MVFGLERRIACNKFVDSDTQSPDINSFIIASSEVDLGCKEEISPNDGEHVSATSPQKCLFGYAKINNFNFLILLIIEYIFGFDIPMAYIMRMQVAEGRD